MSNKIWILNSLEKNGQDKVKEMVDDYIKIAIESGNLIKLNYVNKEVQDFFKASINNEIYKGEMDHTSIQEYVKEYQSSSIIVFVDENGLDERLLNFSKKNNDFILKSELDRTESNWVDFGGVAKAESKEEKLSKTVKEKTNYRGLLLAMLPYMFFIGNYSKKFTAVLTIATLWAILILIYKIARKKVNVLNVGMAGIFLMMSGIRFINPYWTNSIAPLFITLGMCVVFLVGEFLGDGIISFYYKVSQRKISEYHKYTAIWIAVFAIILGQLLYYGSVGKLFSIGLILLAWIITSVNLKGKEILVEEMDVENTTLNQGELNEKSESTELEAVEIESVEIENTEIESVEEEYSEK